MDINLLNDTKEDKPKKKPVPVVSSEPKLTDPGRLPKPAPEPKLPSRFSIWLRSLRNKPPAKEAPKVEPVKPEEKPKIPSIRVAAPPKSPTPEDIFSEIDEPDLKSDAVPPVKNIDDGILPAPKPLSVAPPPATPAPPPTPALKSPPPSPIPSEKPAPKLADKIKFRSKAVKKGEFEPPFNNRGSLVNLIPMELRQSIDPRSKLISLGIALCGSLVLIGGIYASLTLYRTSILEKIQLLRAERMGVEQQINDLKPQQREAIDVSNKLKLVSGLLDSHIYWTKFFSKLEQYTIDEVYYTGAIAGSLGGQMTLSAVGTSFSSPARQLIALEAADDFVSSVTITAAAASSGSSANLPPGSLSTTKVTFAVSITLVPDIFNYTSETFPIERSSGSVGPRAINPLTEYYGMPVTETDSGTPIRPAENLNGNLNSNVNSGRSVLQNSNTNAVNSNTSRLTNMGQ